MIVDNFTMALFEQSNLHRNISSNTQIKQSSLQREGQAISIFKRSREEMGYGAGAASPPLEKRMRREPTPAVRLPLKPKLDENQNHVGNVKLLVLDGIEYPIQQLNEGKYHKVFEFTENKEVVLRSMHPLKNPNQLTSILKTDIAAYDALKREGVPLPRAYVRPDTFIDAVDPRYGGFWILEKMESPAPIGEPFVLEFVRKWVTKSAAEKREIIFDFYPRNVMVKEGSCYVVDPALPDDDDRDDWEENLFKVVIAWSNGQEEIYKFLTANFDSESKISFDNMLKEAKAKNEGRFPVTSQTTL